MRIARAAASLLACAGALGAARCIPAPEAARCETPPGDVVDPCADPAPDGGALPGTPDPGEVPAGSVGAAGGFRERPWVAPTRGTPPGLFDPTGDHSPAAVPANAPPMKGLPVQVSLDPA